MLDLTDMWTRSAPPRTAADRSFFARYEVWSRPLIVAAAVLPLVITTTRSSALGIVVGVGSWLIFLGDFWIQVNKRDRYVASRLGMFDLLVVIVTSPWYLLPGVHAGSVVTLLRLARLARLLVVFHGARRLLHRLGRAALAATAVVLLGSWIAFDAESGVNPEFASYGDSLWWGVVTITTVGYGDIVPITLAGRIAGTLVMVMGIGLLGVLAGSLASFFRLTPAEQQADEQRDEAAADELGVPMNEPASVAEPAGEPPATDTSPQAAGSVTGEAPTIAALQRDIVDLRKAVTSLTEQLRGPDH